MSILGKQRLALFPWDPSRAGVTDRPRGVEKHTSSASPRPRPLGSRAATCLAFSNVYPTAPPVLTEPFKTLTCIQTAQTYRYSSEIALRSALGKHSGETMDSGNSNVFF